MNPSGWIPRQEDGATIGVLLLTVFLLWLASHAARRWIRAHHMTGDSALTVLTAIVGTTFTAQGMWAFFRDTLNLAVFLTAAGFLFFELVQLTCAVRARRKMLDPEIGHAGPEGIVLWVSAGLSGFFSSTHATSWEEALFRLIVPTGVAWLWHQQMGLEKRQLTGKLSGIAAKFAGINWRLTPERVLIKLGLADPTDRTAAQVSAERTLTTLAIAARKAGRERWRPLGWLDRRRLDAALQRATEYAHLSTDPAAQQFLVTTLGVLNGAGDLARLRPVAPWASVVDGQPSQLEADVVWLAEAGMLDLTAAARSALGVSATGPGAPRPARLPGFLKPVDMTPQRPTDEARGNRDSDWPTGGNRPAQDDDPDPRATVIATVREWNARGVGEQKIADDLGVTRAWVRKVLGRDARPATTGVNGHDRQGESAS
jgi:hypothetical protein